MTKALSGHRRFLAANFCCFMVDETSKIAFYLDSQGGTTFLMKRRLMRLKSYRNIIWCNNTSISFLSTTGLNPHRCKYFFQLAVSNSSVRRAYNPPSCASPKACLQLLTKVLSKHDFECPFLCSGAL